MYYDFWNSPIGTLYIEASNTGIRKVTIIDTEDVHSPSPSSLTTQCMEELIEYFEEKRKEFDVVLDFSSGTEFQQEVWHQLLTIPYGFTTSYQTIANKINNPLSVRAVGMANGKNPIPIIVPCHRVIGSNGSLVGYSQGIEIKKHLLRLENPLEFGEQVELF